MREPTEQACGDLSIVHTRVQSELQRLHDLETILLEVINTFRQPRNHEFVHPLLRAVVDRWVESAQLPAIEWEESAKTERVLGGCGSGDQR